VIKAFWNPLLDNPVFPRISTVRRTTMSEQQPTSQEVMKKAAYIAPVILPLKAVPAFAAKGSGWGKSRGSEKRKYVGWGKRKDKGI
jgi:hypothetical protein